MSTACPWAHRTLIFRRLKGLEDMISLSVVNAFMGDEGWTFDEGDDVIADSVNHKARLHEVYTQADPANSGRVTVPVLWDKERKTIVSNESSEIIRIFNSAFDAIGATPGDIYPEPLRDEIDALNDFIYPNISNGGEELFVLAGEFGDEHGPYPTGTYVRNPDQSRHTPYTRDEGALIYVKVGHLAPGRIVGHEARPDAGAYHA